MKLDPMHILGHIEEQHCQSMRWTPCFAFLSLDYPSTIWILHCTQPLFSLKTIGGLFHFTNNSDHFFHTHLTLSLSFSHSSHKCSSPGSQSRFQLGLTQLIWCWFVSQLPDGGGNNFRNEIYIYIYIYICFPPFLPSSLCMSIFECFKKKSS